MLQLLSDRNKRIFGDSYIKELYRELRNDSSSTGKLANSLDYRIVEERNVIEFIINGEDYFKNVDDGRKKGTYPPLSAIENWVQVKGIDKSAVFPIMRSIYKFGIKPKDITRKVENKVFNGAIFEELETHMSEDLENSIIELINKETKE
jgi:hypothetical protein